MTCNAATYRFRDIRGQMAKIWAQNFGFEVSSGALPPKGEKTCPGPICIPACKSSRWSVRGAENVGVQNAGVKNVSDKVWKAIRRKYSKVPNEIWLSWLSCLVVAKRNSWACRPVNVATDTPTTVSADTAVDFCEVCLVAPRDTRIALVPCGHQRFCESCASEVHNQGRGCPLCRTPINVLLRLY